MGTEDAVLKSIFAVIGALVVFGGLLAVIAVAAYHVERRWRQ